MKIREYVRSELNKMLIPIPTEERGLYYDFINENIHVNLNEGLYKTYPPETAKRYIQTLFGLSDGQIDLVRKNVDKPEECRIVVLYSDEYDNKKNMTRAMNLCGYTISKSMKHDDGYLEEVYIPINLPDINEIVRKYDVILHVTPLYYKDKILKNGFVPRSKNVMFSYPDRVFFFRGNIPPQELFFQVADFDDKRKNKLNNRNYCMFAVNPRKIPDDVGFHTDLTYPFGIYTNDNIPSSAIEYYKVFNLDEILKQITF